LDYLTRCCLFSALILLNSLTFADELLEGEWQGSVIMHEQAEQLATFKVRHKNSGFKITMYFNNRPYQFEDLSVGADKMTFALDTGSVYGCELTRKDSDKFSGECVMETEEEKRTIVINMQSPDEIEQEDVLEVEPAVEEVIEEEPGDIPDEEKSKKGVRL